MTTHGLKISDDLVLPIEAVTEKTALLGRTGSGKTYAAQKMAEEMHRLGAQFVALDPVGVWYGLRLAADGKGPGIPIPVLGGLHGDVPLEPTGGKVVADLIVDRALSVVLDVSQFESDADKARFALDFATRLFFRKKAAPAALHLFLEEAQEFVPQHPMGEEARMLHAFTRILKIGRNFGIGASLISQRPQEVNKKVLNLAELLFAFQLTGPHERKAVDGWIADKGIEDEDIAGMLPKLERGAPHVWSPAWLKISRVIQVGRRWTFDASSTPKVGARAAARPLSPIDLDQLRSTMAATIEKAKAEDPKELRRQLAVAHRQLQEARAAKPARPTQEIAPADLKCLKRLVGELGDIVDQTGKDIARVQKAAGELAAVRQFIDKVGAETLGAIQRVLKTIGAAPARAILPVAPTPPRPPSGARGAVSRPQLRSENRTPTAGGEGLKLGRSGARRMLIALAQHPEGITDSKLALLSGIARRGGTFRTYLGQLRSAGYVDGDRYRVRATVAGVTALGDYEPLPVPGPELVDYWRTQLGDSGMRRILDVLVEAYPRTLTRQGLSDETGITVDGGTFRTYLGKLRTLELVTGRGDELRASEDLFT